MKVLRLFCRSAPKMDLTIINLEICKWCDDEHIKHAWVVRRSEIESLKHRESRKTLLNAGIVPNRMQICALLSGKMNGKLHRLKP